MTITPQLVATYPIPDRGNGAQTCLDPTGPVPRFEVRSARSLRIYELQEQAELLAEFPAPNPNPWGRQWTAPDLSFTVFATEEAYVAVTRDGTRLWSRPYGTWEAHRWGDVDFSGGSSADGSAGGGSPAGGSSVGGSDRDLRIWLRMPSGLPDATRILTLDAAGTVLGESLLPCGGYERYVSLLWDENDEVAGVSVSGEGVAQTHYEARWESGALVLGRQVPQQQGAQLPGDRYYLGIDSTNTRCMTADRRGRDLTWHSLPDYRVTATLALSDFPAPGTGDCSVHNAPYISSRSGFVDDDTVIVTLSNTYDEAAVLRFGEDRWREHSHWLADPATGAVHGRLEYPMREVDNVMPVGDGTWITEEWEALYRWRR
ncbi:hypothetical protein [Streptomyces rubellomurinus]|uniref:Uncharacterized protein n=1 Tax=Streptomyces rubellomurinus (strain ATCC 31215) TaxID=359131 RepID=A0A0F2T5Z7_STRR3|nr:hypothetical protein [Streptomyces rubellomurinus]KJS58634.1 hypothetical protein VM95_32035 [Streptomyces rubellomurinus]